MIRRPLGSTPFYSSAASDVYKGQALDPADAVVLAVSMKGATLPGTASPKAGLHFRRLYEVTGEGLCVRRSADADGAVAQNEVGGFSRDGLESRHVCTHYFTLGRSGYQGLLGFPELDGMSIHYYTVITYGYRLWVEDQLM